MAVKQQKGTARVKPAAPMQEAGKTNVLWVDTPRHTTALVGYQEASPGVYQKNESLEGQKAKEAAIMMLARFILAAIMDAKAGVLLVPKRVFQGNYLEALDAMLPSLVKLKVRVVEAEDISKGGSPLEYVQKYGLTHYTGLLAPDQEYALWDEPGNDKRQAYQEGEHYKEEHRPTTRWIASNGLAFTKSRQVKVQHFFLGWGGLKPRRLGQQEMQASWDQVVESRKAWGQAKRDQERLAMRARIAEALDSVEGFQDRSNTGRDLDGTAQE